MLRSMRFGEADRVLHLYTLERGRIGAVAKGIRRTKSRFGARLEPLSHVEAMLHQGSGELQTVTGVELIRSHHDAREDAYRLAVGLISAEAMLRLFTEQEGNPRAFEALTKLLDLLDGLPSRAPARPALDPLALAFQLKLLWVAGYLPHLTSCANCGRGDELIGYSPRAGGAVCRTCGEGALALSPAGRSRDRGPAQQPARRRTRRRPDRARRPRGTRGDHRVVRRARRLPPPHTQERLAVRLFVLSAPGCPRRRAALETASASRRARPRRRAARARTRRAATALRPSRPSTPTRRRRLAVDEMIVAHDQRAGRHGRE